MKSKDNDLLVILANGLAVSLEMSYDEVELRELWGDELEALKRAKDQLEDQGITPPASIVNVLKLAGG